MSLPNDAALALRVLSAWSGHAQLPGDARLEFRPHGPWARGRYVLRADPVLEDICGNRLGRPFDIDRHPAPETADAMARPADLTFEV